MGPFFERTPREQPEPSALSRPSRLVADQATPTGAPLPQVTELARGLDAINAEYALKKANLEAEMEKAHAIQRRLDSLMRVLDEATSNLKRAEEQRAGIDESLARVRSVLLLAWTRPNAADYSFIAAAKEAIADYPRVKLYLQGKVTAAEDAVRAFRREQHL